MTSDDNNLYKLTEMDRDVIGEVMNISMGAAATAMSTILDKKVNITTPRIETMGIDEFEFSYLEPVIGVLIKYVEGIEGTNMLFLREDDLKKILGHLLSMDPADMTELDEISVSAICEIMNQMMGSAAGALASFLGRVVNISPPEIMDTTQRENVKKLFSITGDSLVSIKFNLSIEGLVDSEFISAMDPELVKKIVKMSFGASDMEDEATMVAEAPAAQPPEGANSEVDAGRVVQANPIPQSDPTPPPVERQAPIETRTAVIDQAPKQQVHATTYNYKPLGTEKTGDSSSENNLELIMTVPIQITVELGKTRKKIKDIAELTIGNIVELDRQAGDQVDVVANGRLIARGDVVVVDDNYSVRITEIVKAKENLNESK